MRVILAIWLAPLLILLLLVIALWPKLTRPPLIETWQPPAPPSNLTAMLVANPETGLAELFTRSGYPTDIAHELAARALLWLGQPRADIDIWPVHWPGAVSQRGEVLPLHPDSCPHALTLEHLLTEGVPIEHAVIDTDEALAEHLGISGRPQTTCLAALVSIIQWDADGQPYRLVAYMSGQVGGKLTSRFATACDERELAGDSEPGRAGQLREPAAYFHIHANSDAPDQRLRGAMWLHVHAVPWVPCEIVKGDVAIRPDRIIEFEQLHPSALDMRCAPLPHRLTPRDLLDFDATE